MKPREWLATHRFVLVRIGIPLGMAAVIVLSLSSMIDSDRWAGIMDDLAITAMGVLLTVFYVEVVIQRSAESRWDRFRATATRRTNEVAARIVRNLVLLDPDYKRSGPMDPAMEIIRMNPLTFMEGLYSDPVWIAYVETVAVPQCWEWFQELDFDRVQEVNESMADALEEVTELLLLFQEAYSPEQFEHLTALQQWLKHGSGDHGEYWREITGHGLGEGSREAVNLIKAGKNYLKL